MKNMKNQCFPVLLISLALFFVNLALAEEKIIVLAHEPEWMPHYGENLEEGGYTVALVREALKRVGYSLVTEWLPWPRAVRDAKEGKFDGLGASYYREDRAKFFSYTDPLSVDKVVFYKRKSDTIPYTRMKDLKGYVIGVGLGYVYPEEFENAGFLQKETTVDIKANIMKLEIKRIDIVIGSSHSIQYFISELFPGRQSEFQQLGAPLVTEKLYVLFSKKRSGHQRKTEDFNQGLKMIKEDGTYDKIMKKFGFW